MGVHDGHRERMRKRFMESGLDGFADHEVLELLLYYAIPRRNTNEAAHALVERFGTLNNVLNAPPEMLTQVEGIGEQSALFLNLISRAAWKGRLEAEEKALALGSKEKLGDYLLDLFYQEREEVLYQLCLDEKGRLLSRKRLGTGRHSTVNLDMRKVMENATVCMASSVILAHNHPGGIALPSSNDIAATERAKSVLAAIDVTLEDHMIVADNDYVSIAQSGGLSGG